MSKLSALALIAALTCAGVSTAQPVRKYDDKGAPPFKVLKEGENLPLDAYDNFVIGPKYVPAPERKKVEGVPEGKVQQFVIDSKETRLFNPGIARKQFGKVDPNNPKTLIVETHTIDYKRAVTVFVPAQYKPGVEAPFMVVHDGPGPSKTPTSGLQTILDAAIADHDRRARELATGLSAFEKRVVSYDELTAENRILKADLKNVAIQMAHQDCLLDAARQELAAAKGHRDRLGRDYFAEVRTTARKAITPATYPANKQRVRAAAELLRASGVGLTPADEEQALAELHSQYERVVRAAVEREEQARLREQIREEQRLEREALEAIEQAEQERQVIEAALQRALADVSGRHAAEVDQLRAQLAGAEAKSLRAVSQAMLTKSGNVYVISNRGSFGPDVLKIGMTRRLEPMDRVYELGDASVPFPFDVHMMVKCEDAPKLEAALHRAFHKRRVNKVNPRKEFFRVTVAEVVAAVREQHSEVEYQANAEALEYIQSQTMTDEDLEEVEEVFASAEAAAAVGVGPSGDPDD